MRSARDAGARIGRRAGMLAVAAAVLAATGCSRAPRVALPSGTGTPFPGFLAAYRDATAECGAPSRLSAAIRLSGRAGGTKIAARIDAGFAPPARFRLEGYPRISFGGRPFFILASSGPETVLLMPRDARVLRGASPPAVVEALAGVPLGAADLRAVVAGCGLQVSAPSGGRALGDGWLRLEAGETALFLKQASGRWRVAGAARGGLAVAYPDAGRGSAALARITARGEEGRMAADLELRMSQVEQDPALDERVFEVEVPREARPLTLEELRRAGPLGEPDAS